VHFLARAVLTIAIIMAVIAGYSRFRHHRIEPPPSPTEPAASRALPLRAPQPEPAAYHCDGRTRCSQMTSCEEAKYFLAHCPDVKMDGDHDGIPCESQWCPNG